MQKTMDRPIKYGTFETVIARLYVYLLPIRMIAPLNFLSSVMPGCVVYTDFWLHLLGLLIVFCRNRGKIIIYKDRASRMSYYALLLALVLNFSSLIMSFVIQGQYGNIGTDSALDGIAGMCVYFFQYALIFIYNYEVFRVLDKDELWKILRRVCAALLVFGYFQVFVIEMNNSAIYQFYQNIDIFNIFVTSDERTKLCLTMSEGAGAGSLIAVFVMPVLYGSFLKEGKFKYILQVILWMVPLYYTISTTAYICFVVCSVVFLVLLFVSGNHRAGAGVMLVLAVLALLVLLFPDVLAALAPDIGEKIKYLLTEKATDLTNGSTVSRTVPLIINWKTFLDYPAFGCGNGLQGYFYIKYFPGWAYNAPGSDVMDFYEKAKTGIGNGALFFPSLLSGYGVFGCSLILTFIGGLVSLAKKGKEQMGAFFYMFIMAGVTSFAIGLQSDFYGQYYLWFMLSLPLMADLKEEGSILNYFKPREKMPWEA